MTILPRLKSSIILLGGVVLLFFFGGCKDVFSGDSAADTTSFNSNNRNRAAWQKPSLVIDHLGDLSDKVVADIGAGTGYFAFRLAYQAQKVIAIEIDQDLIDLMEGIKVNLPAEMQQHFETRLGTTVNPNLYKGEADLALIINTITYIEDPKGYLRRLAEGLRPGGAIMVLDYKKNHPIPIPDVPATEDRYDVVDVRRLLASAGYTVTKVDSSTLAYQYMITASYGE